MTAQAFDLTLAPFVLEAGARLGRHVVTGTWLGAPLGAPVIVVVPALTGNAHAGGPGGFWEPLIGPGRALDTNRYRILCCNLLGSCHGTSGAADVDFPRAHGEHPAPVPPAAGGKGAFTTPWQSLPATVTTWDQARSLAMTLDALGVHEVHLVTGGSLGGMVALTLAATLGTRVARVAPLGACMAASAWLLAWNHVARRTLLEAMQRGEPAAGLSLARQLAMISYRAPASLQAAQGRNQVQKIPWHPQAPYRVQTWLENHGSRLAARFDAASYYCLLGAMDHHDVTRASPEGCSLADVRARVHSIAIENDQLFVPADAERLAVRLEAQGTEVYRDCMHSAHGHDALFLAWDELARVLRAALS